MSWRESFPHSGEVAVERHVLNGEVAAHGHDFLELAFVVGGRGTHRSFAGDAALRPETLIVVRPNAWHAYLAPEALEVVNVCFPVSLLGRELWPVESSFGLRRLLRDAPLDPSRRGVLLAEAQVGPLLEDLETATRPLARSASLLRLLDALEPVGEALSTSTVPPAVARVLSAMEGDLAREWDRAALAKIAGVGEAHLSRLFVAAVGVAPMAYLRRMRLTEAAARLPSRAHTIGEIAASVGYLDANLFARRFRQEFGRTPSEVRESGTYAEGV